MLIIQTQNLKGTDNLNLDILPIAKARGFKALVLGKIPLVANHLANPTCLAPLF
ncbi:hypothetical protein JT259_07740 [Helicobacter pylori]|nr:hypothetical protein [Helicobacter pylori]